MNDDVVVGVAGRGQRLDLQAARLGRPVTTSMPKRSHSVVLVLDVVGVAVRAQDSARRHAPALDRLEQRLDRRAASRRRTASPPSSAATT